MKKFVFILIVAFISVLLGCSNSSNLSQEEIENLKKDSLLISDTSKKNIFEEVKITSKPTKESGNYVEEEIK
jgi:hypothetical protein